MFVSFLKDFKRDVKIVKHQVKSANTPLNGKCIPGKTNNCIFSKDYHAAAARYLNLKLKKRR